ncbi:MAG: ankyrin repeat domain-containing protein, partial [Candidatus Eremiobacteraeota bacterium]|nr:ankyrin repeat domain-containing protein [Candidatus Eremiobacteraeota bacterium]
RAEAASMSQELIAAVESNSLARVQELLAAGADPNTCKGKTHVYDLVHRRRDDIRCALLEAGAWFPELVNQLVWAVGTGRLATVAALVEKGADLHLETYSGLPLAAAAGRGHLDIVEYLLQAGADPNSGGGLHTALTGAIAGGFTAVVAALLKGGADPELAPKHSQVTPLAMACVAGHAEMVRALLEAGADLYRPSSFVALPGAKVAPANSTPLQLAKLAGQPQVAEVLMAAGAAPANEHQPVGQELLAACRDGKAAEVEAALANGTPPDAREPDDESAAQMARHLDPARIREMGLSLGRTALMLALENDHESIALRLIEAGADPEATDSAGSFPLLLACEGGHLEAARALLEAGAKPERQAKDKSTALARAIEEGHRQLALWLLEQPALTKKKGPLNKALVVACQHCMTEVIGRLVAAGAKSKAAVAEVTCSSHWVSQPPAGARSVTKRYSDKGVRYLVPFSEQEMLAAIEVLLEAGHDPEAEGALGTPLAGAARHGYQKLAERLLQAGAAADPTALETARLYRHEELARWLEQKGATPPPAEPETVPEPVFRYRRARRPSLGRAAQGKRFQRALAELAERCGSAPIELTEQTGAYRLYVKSDREFLLEDCQDDYLAQGCVVVCTSGPEHLLVLPGKDPLRALAVMQTDGVNHDVGSGNLIDWLEELRARHPFRLLGVNYDTVTGRFLKPIDDPHALAEEFYRWCPDIVEQGCETIEELARQLKTSGQLYLWWD